MINTLALSEDQIELAASLIKTGKLVVFPTETVFGLGANALLPMAVANIFSAKGRPQDNPLIVHIASLAALDSVAVEVGTLAQVVLQAFCPGPITVILKRHPDLAREVSAGLETVGVRIPASDLARRFLAACATPVAAPSANRSGRPSPTNFAMAWAEMNGRVDAVLRGPDSDVGLESTIVWPQNEQALHILRPGSISPEMLRSALDAAGLTQVKIIQDRQSPVHGAEILPLAPGTRYRHYSPLATVHLFSTVQEFSRLCRQQQFDPQDCAVFLLETEQDMIQETQRFMDSARMPRVFANLGDYSRNLYRCLVEADSLGCQHILASLPETADIGLALRDRLRRAAGFHD